MLASRGAVGSADATNTSAAIETSRCRILGGGGYTIDDLWENSSTKFGQSDDFVAPAEDYGNRISYWHGVDLNISGCMRNSSKAARAPGVR